MRFRYRDLEEMMPERGLHVDHTTIYRWVQRSAPELEKHCRPHLHATSDSWRVDETSVKVKGVWMDLYRAVDSQGKTVEFHLSPPRDAQVATRFFAKALGASHTGAPRVITVDKNAASPKAFRELKAAGTLAASCELRQSKYLNTLVEQRIASPKIRSGSILVKDELASVLVAHFLSGFTESQTRSNNVTLKRSAAYSASGLGSRPTIPRRRS